MDEIIISCKDLIHVYPGKKENVVLNGLNIEISKLEKVAIMGKSGSGKSTLLNIFGSLIIPTGGQILIDNINIRNLNLNEILDFRRNTVGFVFEENNLVDFLSVEENIELPLKFADVGKLERKKRINLITEKLEIRRYLNSYPNELSGGEKQRVGIAVALVNYPKIILADEPTGNLDVGTAKLVYELLVDMAEQLQITLVIVTHDHLIKNYVDRVIDLNDLKQYSKHS